MAFLPCVVFILFQFPTVVSSAYTSHSNLSISQSRVYTWHTIHDPTVVMEATNSPRQWVSRSLMRCILECTSRVIHCNAVLYHRHLKTCRAGIAVSRLQNNLHAGSSCSSCNTVSSGPSDPNEVIYSKTLNVCDANLGYTLRYNPESISCVQTFPTKLTHEAARQECHQNGGGRLFSLGTNHSFSNIPGLGSPVFIGLQRTRDGYYWTDGTKLSRGTPAWTDIWATGHPGSGSLGACVILAQNYRMYEVDCGMSYGFICELPVV